MDKEPQPRDRRKPQSINRGDWFTLLLLFFRPSFEVLIWYLCFIFHRANLNSKHLLRYEGNRETITRGGRIKRTYNLAFEIESESSAKRARSTKPCQAEGSEEDVGTMAEDEAETDVEQRKDQFLRTVERLLKPSARKRHVIGGEKKKELVWRRYVVDETKWPGTIRCCGKTFSCGGSFRYHVEKNHVKNRRFRLGE